MEWGINLQFNNRLSNVSVRLILFHSVVIFLAILLVGLSIKEYACFLVNAKQMSGQMLVDMLNRFFWKIGIAIFTISGLFSLVYVTQLIRPIQWLAKAVLNIKEGNIPRPIDFKASGEIKQIIQHFHSLTTTLHSIQEQQETMVRDMSHAFRTPLTNIQGYLEALQNGVIDGHPDVYRSLLEESQRLTRIVEQVRELHAWKERGDITKTHQPLAIHQLLRQTILTFQPRLDACFQEVITQIEPAMIEGHPDGLTNAVSNILQNLLEYNTGDRLIVRGTKGDDNYIISFQHKGEWINPAEKNLLFQPFYQSERSRSLPTVGAGLGLTLSQHIICAHSGQIGIDTDGFTHTFWMKLPFSNERGKETCFDETIEKKCERL